MVAVDDFNMRNLREETKSWAGFITAVFSIGGAVGLVVVFIVSAAFQLFGASLIANAGLATATNLDALSGRVDALARRVEIVSAPGNVLSYHPDSRVLSPTCARGEVCRFRLKFRRARGAEDCERLPIAPERPDEFAIYTLTSDVDFETRSSYRTNEVRIGRVGSIDYSIVEVDVAVPATMPVGSAFMVVETAYTNCPWQRDGEPAAPGYSFRIPFNVG